MNVRRLLSRSLFAAALAVAAWPARPADSAVVGVFVGSGTMVPGLTATPAVQNIALGGQLNFIGCGVGLVGVESLAVGMGVGAADCGFALQCPPNTINHNRVGSVVVWTGNCQSTGAPCRLAGTFLFAPTNPGPPVTSFAMVGPLACA